MKKENIGLASQLLNSMLDALDKLESAREQENFEEFRNAKKSILSFQKELDKII